MTARQPGIEAVLGRALAQLAARPPGARAVVDQNTEVLRARLARAGVPVTPAAVAAFAAGVAELDFQAAASLLHAAAQLAAPSASPGCVTDLDRALAGPGSDQPAVPGPGGELGPRGGAAR